MIAIAVRRHQFAGGQETHLRHAAHILGIQAALAAIGMADLAQEFSIRGEFQHEAVVINAFFAAAFLRRAAPARELRRASRRRAGLARAIGGDPHIAVLVDGDAMVGGGPVMAVILAPVMNQSAAGIEGQDVGRRRAAIAFVACLQRFIGFQRAGAVNDPDIVARIHRSADDLAQHPAVGHGLGPKRIGFEFRHHHIGGALRPRRARHGQRAGTQQGDGGAGHQQACRRDISGGVFHENLPGKCRLYGLLAALMRDATPAPVGRKDAAGVYPIWGIA